MSHPKTQTFPLVTSGWRGQSSNKCKYSWYYRFVSTTSKVMISAKNSSRMLSGVDSTVMCADPLLFPFGGHGGCVHWVDCGCWPAICWTAPSSSEVLAEKSGLDRICELAEAGDGGRGSTSSSSVVYASHCTLSLSESITISHIWFGDSRRARLAREASRRSILQLTETHPHRVCSKFQLSSDDNLQTSLKEMFLSPCLETSTCLL